MGDESRKAGGPDSSVFIHSARCCMAGSVPLNANKHHLVPSIRNLPFLFGRFPDNHNPLAIGSTPSVKQTIAGHNYSTVSWSDGHASICQLKVKLYT